MDAPKRVVEPVAAEMVSFAAAKIVVFVSTVMLLPPAEVSATAVVPPLTVMAVLDALRIAEPGTETTPPAVNTVEVVPAPKKVLYAAPAPLASEKLFGVVPPLTVVEVPLIAVIPAK
ncbi:hypothetical protein Acid7E03_10040 [Acidisoma sp. 7E03]